jgi:hypothetical protein
MRADAFDFTFDGSATVQCCLVDESLTRVQCTERSSDCCASNAWNGNKSALLPPGMLTS